MAYDLHTAGIALMNLFWFNVSGRLWCADRQVLLSTREFGVKANGTAVDRTIFPLHLTNVAAPLIYKKPGLVPGFLLQLFR